jgi:AraC-like DNA-binding protein
MCAALVTSASVFKDQSFPVAAVRMPNHGASDGLHRHEFHELVIITDGRGRHLTDVEDYPLTAGDAFLLRGNMQHGYADVDQMSLINVLFKPAALGLPLKDLGDLTGYQVLFHVEPRLRCQARFRGRLHMSPTQLAEAVRLAVQLEGELRARAPGYRFTARAQLMQLVAHLSRCYTAAKRTGPQPLLRLGELLSYLDRHYCEPISIEQMLPIARMSQSTLMRTFHRVFQRSPVDYLIRLRIQKATELLADGELRIGEVALACGFSDSNYFTRQFRRVTGRSPREYRKAE